VTEGDDGLSSDEGVLNNEIPLMFLSDSYTDIHGFSTLSNVFLGAEVERDFFLRPLSGHQFYAMISFVMKVVRVFSYSLGLLLAAGNEEFH